ncbi:Putative sugar phosphate/phosphate translocator [Tolypocladium paradoxum]|uniref:Sugar phosphate/phosphate translocator n=1 Tax=Tolypocladium paradoxum TaxID=94208 RepID=A0A2S4L033_9HYPO|nr:Putative sugar phosphate/phosphate translocator [Tolypocladium paradoxum]
MSSSSSSSSPSSAKPSATFGVADDGAALGKRQPAWGPLHASSCIFAWILLSNLTILLNKWLIDTAGFRYPILLTCWHFVFATVAIQVLARTTTWLDSRQGLGITPRLYVRTIMPIAVFFSASLVCSNFAYMYLSVPFIQMLNAANPAAVLVVSWLWRVADPSLATLLNMLLIVAGAALASLGEIQFSLVGFLFQVGGIVAGAIRLVMIQVLVSRKGMKMDALVGLYYFGPACAAMNFAVALCIELPRFEMADLANAGFGLLFLNALVAFILNITTVYLIGKTSGLVMALTGIFKNIMLIVASVIIWNTQITAIQGVGYTIALTGLTYHWLGNEHLATGYRAAASWAAGMWDMTPARAGTTYFIATRRRVMLVAAVGLSGLCMMLWPLGRYYDARAEQAVAGTE